MLLKIENLKKEYKTYKNNVQRVLNNINIEIKSGEFVCIYGESGSGKSTLMNIIGGLDNEYSGNIFIESMNLKNINIDEYKSDKIGFIFQKYNLLSNLNVLENVMLPLDIIDMKQKDKIKEAKEILEKLGLKNFIYKKPNELSGGQMQRVAIARALVKNPDIILADEPTGALDFKNSENILKTLKDIASEGKIVIVVTHSDRVKKYASRVVTLEYGNIIKDNKIKDFVIENKAKMFKSKKINNITCMKFGINNILSNIKRNILLSVAASIGIIGITISLFIGNGVKNYIEKEINDKVDPLSYSVIKKNTNELYDITYFKEKDIKKIKNIKQVKSLSKNVSYQSSTYLNYNNKKYDLVSLSSFNNMKEEDLLYGKVCQNNQIVISEYLANKLTKNKKDVIGKEVEIYIIDSSSNEPFLLNKKMTISGIYKNSKVELINNSFYAYMSYNAVNEIYKENNRNLLATNIDIKVNDNDNIDLVKKKIDKLGYKLSSVNEYADNIFKYLDMATLILSSFSSISLIVSCIMIIIVFSINVVERTKEIGILKSLGLNKKDIKRIFKTEAILIGFITSVISYFVSSILSKTLSDIIYTNYKVHILDINIKYVLFSSIISIVVCITGSIIPSNKASKLNTIDALRYE